MKRKAQKKKSKATVSPKIKGKHPGGRPTKFEPVLAKKIVDAIKAGGYVETAVAFVGIRKDTFYNWLRRGADEKSGPFKDFSDAVGQAISESEMRYVAMVARAANGYDVVKERTVIEIGQDNKPRSTTTTTEKTHEFNVQAAEWWLERRFPRRWGRMERAEISEAPEGTRDEPIATLKRETIDIYAPDRLARLISAFGEAGFIPEEATALLAPGNPA